MLGARELVIPRADCIHHRIPLNEVPARERFPAARLAVRKLAIADKAPFALIWVGSTAHVWLVDPSLCSEIGQDERIICESALVAPPPAPDAVRLVKLKQGYEGQAWRAGELACSRWWKNQPMPDEWARFLRAASLSSAAEVPDPEEAVYAASPWGRAQAPLFWQPAQLERAFWRASSFSVAALVAWSLAAGGLWAVSANIVQERLAALREDAAPLIDARERAEALAQRADALLRLSGDFNDAELQTYARELLPADDRMARWTRDGDQLRFEIVTGSTDPRPYVQAFSGHPAFRDVVVNPVDGGRLRFEIELSSLQQATR